VGFGTHGTYAPCQGTHNAVAESFFGTLKNELVHHEKYKTREQARLSIFDYIEMFYNKRRTHSHLNYLSPEDFEKSMIAA